MPEDIEEECRLRREEAIRLARAAEEAERRRAEEHEREMRKWQELREHRRRRRQARQAKQEREMHEEEKAERERIWAEAYAKSFREWREKAAAEEAAQAAVAEWNEKYQDWIESERLKAEALVRQGLSGAQAQKLPPLKKPPATLGDIVLNVAGKQLKRMVVSYCIYKAKEALFGDDALDGDEDAS